ncbi:MAG: PH domain-containing protein [Phycisphaerae bacterium]|nr:PH domain-containing protein [Phycisphaerae bacterium]
MTPSAEPASTAVTEDTLVPEQVLDEGEFVILAIKPSGWFVLLVSWPVLAIAAVVVVVGYLAGEAFGVPCQTVMLFALAAACARVVLASCQWLGRLYMLTNRRVLRIGGIIRMDVFACPLKKIRHVQLHAGPAERVLALDSLLFTIGEAPSPAASWNNISRGEEVLRIVNEAIRREQ